jgi:hypothetical protein
VLPRGVAQLRRFSPTINITKVIISFSWTPQALLDRKKTVTRRDWPDFHAKKFRVGAVVTAYDKQPCWGGRPVARIQIVSVRRESLNELYSSPRKSRLMPFDRGVQSQ